MSTLGAHPRRRQALARRGPGEDTSNEWLEPVTDEYETLK